MILVRDVFRVKFGKMKDAVSGLKEGAAAFKNIGIDFPVRALTDLTGPYYTLVLEMTMPDLATWEKQMQEGFNAPEWQAWYAKFAPYLEDGHREVFTIVM